VCTPGEIVEESSDGYDDEEEEEAEVRDPDLPQSVDKV
jgi:hypothetical protein